MLPFIRKLLETLESNNYHIYTKPFQLNIVGIRKDDARIRTKHNMENSLKDDDNIFCDQLVIFYYDEQENLEFSIYEINTVPSIKSYDQYYIVIPNQYEALFTIKDNRLIQHKEVDVFRDTFENNNAFFDPFSIQTGYFDITFCEKNLDYSCHRFRYNEEFTEFLELCLVHESHYGNSFTYTLLEEHQVIQHNETKYMF